MRCKPLYNIICLLLVAFLFSCSKNAVEFDEQLSNTRALLSIDLTQNAGEEQVAIKTVRFVIFGNASSIIPYLDVNEFHEEATPLETTDIKAVIEVKGNSDIMAIVIVNEPAGLKSDLDNIGSLSDLKNIEFTIAQLLNNSKEEIALMPMTGIKQGIYVKPGEAVNPVSMTVERAVSRVDVYLQVTDGGAQTGYINGSTTVTMHNLSHESVLVNGFGNMKANALPLDKTWTAGSSDTWIYSSAADAKNRRLLCSFYTSERAFTDSNKPTISMTNIRKGAQPTDVIGVTRQELGQITPTGGGQSQDFEGFQRNNVYQITAKVGKLGIQIVRVSVEPWGDPKNIDVDVEL